MTWPARPARNGHRGSFAVACNMDRFGWRSRVMGSVQPGMSEGRKSRWRSRRGWAVLVVLAGLASAGAAWGFAADQAALGPCGHIVTTMRASEPSYAPGHAVIVTVTQVNAGPACSIPPQLCGPPQVLASAYNSAGEDVWDYGAQKTIPGHATCELDGPRVTWAAGHSDTRELNWGQDECTRGTDDGQPGQPNPGCPATRLPAGTYRITGEFWWIDGTAGGHGPPASATITITS